MTLRNQFILKVRTRDSKTHEVTVKREWTIATLKDNLREALSKSYGEDTSEHFSNLNNDSMRILCKGRVLNDDQIVGDHLSADVVCHLVIRNLGASTTETESSASPQTVVEQTAAPAEPVSTEPVSQLFTPPTASNSTEAESPATQTSSSASTNTPQTQSLTGFLENMVREFSNSINQGNPTAPVHVVFGAQELNAPLSQAASSAQPSQAQEAPAAEGQSRRRPNPADPVRNVRRALGLSSSRSPTAARLSDFELPAVSSVHLHVHASVDDLDRVANRRS